MRAARDLARRHGLSAEGSLSQPTRDIGGSQRGAARPQWGGCCWLGDPGDPDPMSYLVGIVWDRWREPREHSSGARRGACGVPSSAEDTRASVGDVPSVGALPGAGSARATQAPDTGRDDPNVSTRDSVRYDHSALRPCAARRPTSAAEARPPSRPTSPSIPLQEE